MRIAIFDYLVRPTNPIGGCHWRMLRELHKEHQFTVFSVEFDNPCPSCIEWVRIPAPRRPLALLFVAYHVLAPLCYWIYRWRRKVRFDLVQMVESNLSFGDIAYSHFCHRAYLREHWSSMRTPGLRGFLRWLDHNLHASMEGWVYSHVNRIIVPSAGLGRQLGREYPSAAHTIAVIPNAVETTNLTPLPTYNRAAFRASLGAKADDLLLVFAALGHFERKGLPLIIEALKTAAQEKVKLVVVGGEGDSVHRYRKQAQNAGLGDRIVFVGMQCDVRPYLWAAEAFIFPSHYETFSLVCFEAAAAGVPVIAPNIFGVEEFLVDGQSGLLVERTVTALAGAILRFSALPTEERNSLGECARRRVQPYDVKHFAQNWRRFYADLSLA